MKKLIGFSFIPNALMAHFTHSREDVRPVDDLVAIGCVLVASSLFLLLLIDSGSIVILCVFFILSLPALASCTLLPALISINAWRFTTPFLRDKTDDLLRLTNLSGSSILWSYIGASLYRWRITLRVTAGLMPLLLFSQVFIITLYQSGVDNLHWCVTSPLGNAYCNTVDENGRQPENDRSQMELQIIVAGVFAAAGIVGICVLAALSGVGIAYWLRELPHFTVGAIALFATTGIVWTLFFIELGYAALLGRPPENSSRLAIYCALFGGLPCLLILVGGKVCLRLVSKQD